jgi:hypothetical protein
MTAVTAMPDRAAEEFGKIGCHGGDLTHDPCGDSHRGRKLVVAHLGQVAAGNDAELGRQRLEQHGDQVRHDHDPEQ